MDMSDVVLLLNEHERFGLWDYVANALEDYLEHVRVARVAPASQVEEVRNFIRQFTFTSPLEPLKAIEAALQGLWQFQLHSAHPRCFGLFVPAPTTMGIIADALVAAFNPQLAAWSHSPFAIEIEQHLVGAFSERFGYDPKQSDGTFTSGGAEANHTALITALASSFPEFLQSGLRGLAAQPLLYLSSQSHHSLVKAAKFCGLGLDAIRRIPTNHNFQMDVRALAEQIRRDRADGYAPFFVVATAGTTNAGIIEPLAEIASIAAQEQMWFHVDAAWGGAAMLLPEFRPLFAGIERADSITFDAHKWLSVPMGAGVYLTRHLNILSQTCTVAADYMPREEVESDIVDPYLHSLQWSRRFIGLKVFLSLAVAGWQGYEAVIRHQTQMGEMLRQRLTSANWQVVNLTPLPVVCFYDAEAETGNAPDYLSAIAERVVESGKAWISTTRLDAETFVLRACITNFRTQEEDVLALVQVLNEARKSASTRR